MEFAAVAAGTVIVLLMIALILVARKAGGLPVEPPHKAAGRRGEYAAERRIRSVLREGDTLFTNVSVSFDGKPAELDNVIVNSYGVFIIEVKNYSGRLSGGEEDYEWTKVHISRGGKPYVKTVKNPIRQVKRQTYILAKYLDRHGVSVWVEGYATILGTSSPVQSRYLLPGVADFDRAIHTPGKRRLNAATVDAVKKLLS